MRFNNPSPRARKVCVADMEGSPGSGKMQPSHSLIFLGAGLERNRHKNSKTQVSNLAGLHSDPQPLDPWSQMLVSLVHSCKHWLIKSVRTGISFGPGASFYDMILLSGCGCSYAPFVQKLAFAPAQFQFGH